LRSLVFAEGRAPYLVGAAAALKNTAGNVGYIGNVRDAAAERSSRPTSKAGAEEPNQG
jgi:basic membrane lipoprotein Med (substrate-binding protein (PBP1-ABC) superfamily)